MADEVDYEMDAEGEGELEAGVPDRLKGRIKVKSTAQSSRSQRGERDREGNTDYRQRYGGRSGKFESIRGDRANGPQRSKEGYILFVTNLNAETQEDDISDHFKDFGEILNLNLNLDRRTGFVKGYAFVEFASLAEAQKAIEETNGSTLLESQLNVGFAFKQAPARAGREAGMRRMSPPRRRGREDMDDEEPYRRSKKR